MPQRGDIPINNFVNGLITEANPLSFPQGSSLDEINFELLRNGSRRKRLGLDFEDNYGLLPSGLDSSVLENARCQAYRWSIPNGHIDQDIGVIQIGNQIWFLDLFTANPSANVLNGGNPIIATGVNNDVIMTFTTLNNYLIGIANSLPQPYLFTYDPVTDTVTIETAAILVRDVWGVDDGLAIDGRPTTLSPAHHYNLLNQGWVPDIESTCGVGISAIDCTFNTFGVYPSNSDQWTFGRIEDLTSADVKKFDPAVAGRSFVNNGQVARGHFIFELYNRGTSRSTQTGLTLPADRETGRINAIASYAGRVFYAGILSKVIDGDNRSPNLSGTVLFSQLFENKINLVKCYQEADPTSPDISDIVDTDGGLIQIPECGYIWALKAIKESLFVFASNGVWEIRGGDNGFTATSYMVHKISNVGVYAPKSIVEVEGIIYFWAATGIHAIGRNENGVFQTTNLTINSIQTLYNAIPDASKKNARGYYDLAQNRARWLYYSSETKVLGNPVDIDVVPVLPFKEITTPVPASFGFTMNYVDCAVLDADRYVIIGTRWQNGSRFIYGVIVTVAEDNSLIFSSIQLVDNTVNDYKQVSVCALTPTKIFISSINDITNTTYGIYCTVSTDTITKQSITAIGTTAAGPAVHSKSARIDNDRALVQYQGSVSGQDVFIADISSGVVVFGPRTSVSSFSLDRGDLEGSLTPGLFYSFCVSSGGQLRVHPITVSGDTTTIGTLWPDTTMDSNSILYNITFLTTGVYAVRARNSTSGSRIRVVDSTGNLATITTTNTNEHIYADIVGTTRNRFYLFYSTGTSLDYEEFSWNGGATITSSGVASLQESAVPISINIADDGFTPTKVPIVYIDNTNGNGHVMTFVLEAGA